MRPLLILLVLVVTGCGSIYEAEQEQKFGEAIFATEPWADKALTRAVAFWALRGEKFHQGVPGGLEVVVTPLPPDRDGQCGNNRIEIVPALEGGRYMAPCVIAHELGHYLGMNHVGPLGTKIGWDGKLEPLPTKSLMSPYEATDDEGNCYWSWRDQAELDRVRNTGARSLCP